MFINLFFANNLKADIGKQGGTFGPDDILDNNDFVIFISQFFTGC